MAIGFALLCPSCNRPGMAYDLISVHVARLEAAMDEFCEVYDSGVLFLIFSAAGVVQVEADLVQVGFACLNPLARMDGHAENIFAACSQWRETVRSFGCAIASPDLEPPQVQVKVALGGVAIAVRQALSAWLGTPSWRRTLVGWREGTLASR